MRSACFSKFTCSDCGAHHHTLLHIPTEEKITTHSSNEDTDEIPTTSKGIFTSKLPDNNPIFRGTLLATAIIQTKDFNGDLIPIRALIDLGGEASAITENMVQLLRLKKNRCFIKVDHLDNTHSKSNAYVNLIIEIHYHDWSHLND